jgi:hypothetical protein
MRRTPWVGITVLLIVAGACGVFLAGAWSMGSVQAALFGDPPAAVAPVVLPAPPQHLVPRTGSAVPIHPTTPSSEPRRSATGSARCTTTGQ